MIQAEGAGTVGWLFKLVWAERIARTIGILMGTGVGVWQNQRWRKCRSNLGWLLVSYFTFAKLSWLKCSYKTFFLSFEYSGVFFFFFNTYITCSDLYLHWVDFTLLSIYRRLCTHSCQNIVFLTMPVDGQQKTPPAHDHGPCWTLFPISFKGCGQVVSSAVHYQTEGTMPNIAYASVC